MPETPVAKTATIQSHKSDSDQVGSDRGSDQAGDVWPMRVVLRKRTIERGLWEVDDWSALRCLSDRQQVRDQLGFEAQPGDQPASTDYCWHGLSLELFRDERAAYRFNISSHDPRLFIVCAEEDELMQPYLLTASQDVASSYMDGGEEDVYSIPMPEAVQCWIEGFIGRHGEPEMELGKSKRRHHGRRKGAGKSQETGSTGGARG
ncbi:DUF3305 domain-containing protein [Motiliproteus sp.]|uniref:DUF3305 domain-containing protein n=1 Tax=Motiliproteus sp. TaxID=1898955 RepID=UPI003BA9D34F